MRSIQWKEGSLIILDQTKLPSQVLYFSCTDYRRVGEAIKKLEVRGAPAIGVAAAYAMVLGAREILNCEKSSFEKRLLAIGQELKKTRPTAVNLAWAVDRMLSFAKEQLSIQDEPAVLALMEQEADRIAKEDSLVNDKISLHGSSLFSEKVSVLTHCNAGALATAEIGTALGVLRRAWANGFINRVFADETRPLLQGARLTVWELMQDNIPVTLITDNMAGWVMKQKMVQAVIVGADRIAQNGDVANKIGTYSVAVLAREHNIPFYVAAPVSTFDFTLPNGDAIPIEERGREEITMFGSVQVAPEGAEVYNPAFDITPHQLVTAIITEHGVLKAPYTKAIQKLSEMKGGF